MKRRLLDWFSPRERYFGNFSFLEIDMHSHLLPAIDDGSQSPEDSVRFIEQQRALGWKGFITTPHILADLYPNTRQTIEAAHARLQPLLSGDFHFTYAAEYMTDEYFETHLQTGDLLSFGDQNVLIEMSYLAESPRIREYIFDLRVKGYRPVLAHPERYRFYHKQYEKFRELKDAGCELQLNLLSLTGYYGSAEQHIAHRLLADRLYSFAGTDLHHERHASALEAMTHKRIMKTLQVYPFLNSNLR